MISLAEYQKTLGKKEPKAVNLLHGEEEYLIKTFLDKLKEIYRVRVLWGDELTLQDFERLALTGGIFEREETLFVYRSLEFFKGLKDYKQFLSLLERLRNKRVFFYVETGLTEKELQKEPFRSLSKIGEVISARRLDKKRIRELVKKKLQKGGIEVEEEALDYLLEAFSYDLMLLKGETDKLLLYGASQLSLEDIRRVVFAQRERSLFDFLDGILLKDYQKAIEALNSTLRTGTHSLQLFTFLVNSTLKLYTAKVLLEEGKKVEEALTLLDIKHPFQVLNFKKYLERNSKEEIWFLLERLHLLDLNMKVYYSDPAQSIRNFVIEYMLHEEGAYHTADARDYSGVDAEP
ncbi:MAG: DNA polymerase III subunit delta [Aquificaceae bacterium]|nr:DNA polymerase III subunit delta [Aquificaceae bacterium]